jgi:hypothetical protein
MPCYFCSGSRVEGSLFDVGTGKYVKCTFCKGKGIKQVENDVRMTIEKIKQEKRGEVA